MEYNFGEIIKETERNLEQSILALSRSFKKRVTQELDATEQSKAIADAEKLVRTLERVSKWTDAPTPEEEIAIGCTTFAEAGGEPPYA